MEERKVSLIERIASRESLRTQSSVESNKSKKYFVMRPSLKMNYLINGGDEVDVDLHALRQLSNERLGSDMIETLNSPRQAFAGSSLKEIVEFNERQLKIIELANVQANTNDKSMGSLAKGVVNFKKAKRKQAKKIQ